MRTEFVTPDHPLWEPAKAYVRKVYAVAYSALVSQFAGELAVGLDCSGRVMCVAGLRSAPETFFSQHYIDAPVHQILGRLAQNDVSLEEIIEISSMACKRPVAAFALLDAITVEARRRGKRWAVFTATGTLRAMLERAGIAVADLGEARPNRVANPEEWGRYYLTEPRVCAVRDDEARPLIFSPRHPELCGRPLQAQAAVA